MRKYLYVKSSEKNDKILSPFPSAGPYPCVSGMRKIWGEDSFIIKSGAYIYNVNQKTFNYFLYN